jgi:uncharacterized protein (TIGR03435 family)
MMRKVALARLATLIVALALSASISTAQTPQPPKSWRFEAATIKPSDPKLEANSYSSTRGGLFQMVNAPLKQWVELGLSVKDYALKTPAWLDTSRFDLNARLPPAEPVNQDPKAEMMKALLIERFGLKWHEEPGIVSGFELVTGKKVLAQPEPVLERLRGVHGTGSGSTVINGTNMQMSELAALLGEVLGRPVVDSTHLTGGFDIQLRWRPSDTPPTDEERRLGKQYGVDVDNLPSSVATALQEQLGLGLQRAKVPKNVIVVDQMNRQPTAN